MHLTSNNNRQWRRATGGLIMGRTTLLHEMWTNDSDTAQSIGAEVEIMYNACTEDPLDMCGRPMVKGREAGGGPMYAYKCTQVPGGADLAESILGNSHDFAGVVPFNLDNEHRTSPDRRVTIGIATFTLSPSPGDTLTLSGGAVIMVDAVDGLSVAASATKFTLYNYVTGHHTGAGTTEAIAVGETFTSDNAVGGPMNPTPATVRWVSVGDEQVANIDATDGWSASDLTGDNVELIWVMTEGITMAWCDDANGAIADGDPLTWPDYGWHLVEARLNASATDNIIATALQAHTGGATEELLKIHLFKVEPIVYFACGVATTPGHQGVEPQ